MENFIAVRVRRGIPSNIENLLVLLFEENPLLVLLQLQIKKGILYQGERIVASVKNDILVISDKFPLLNHFVGTFELFESPFPLDITQ